MNARNHRAQCRKGEPDNEARRATKEVPRRVSMTGRLARCWSVSDVSGCFSPPRVQLAYRRGGRNSRAQPLVNTVLAVAMAAQYPEGGDGCIKTAVQAASATIRFTTFNALTAVTPKLSSHTSIMP